MKTIQKTVSLFLTILVFVLCLSACGGESIGKNSGANSEMSGEISSMASGEASGTESSETSGETSGGANSDQTGEVSSETSSEYVEPHKGPLMEELKWTAREGIINKDRYLLISLENASQYTIFDFELTFTEKSDLSEEDRNEFFNDLIEIYEVDITDPDEQENLEELKKEKIGMNAEIEMLVHPGQVSSNYKFCYYSGYYYVTKAAHFDLVTPDIATICYLDEGQIITMYYDFVSGKYTTESKVKPAVDWPTSKCGEILPKPEAEVILLTFDYGDSFDCKVYGITQEKFRTYTEQCRSAGFEEDVYSDDSSFWADTSDGGSLMIGYDADEQCMDISFYLR